MRSTFAPTSLERCIKLSATLYEAIFAHFANYLRLLRASPSPTAMLSSRNLEGCVRQCSAWMAYLGSLLYADVKKSESSDRFSILTFASKIYIPVKYLDIIILLCCSVYAQRPRRSAEREAV
jgi:hypothetical protein